MTRPLRLPALATVVLVTALLAGCSGADERPVIGAPEASPTAPTPTARSASPLGATWDLSGSALPADWPDLPLPAGSRVANAYSVGTGVNRTWTATFIAAEGTAADLAKPVVDALRDQGFRPGTQVLGAPDSNSGVYSLSDDSHEVFIVLGEESGRASLVMSIRQSPAPAGGVSAEPDAKGATP